MADYDDKLTGVDLLQGVDVTGAENIEVAGDQDHITSSHIGKAGGSYDFGSSVHCSRSSWAVAATRWTVTADIQRWSMGHSRSRQGLHSACSRTTRAKGPVGPVVVSVAPKTVTVGTPRAEAMCMAP